MHHPKKWIALTGLIAIVAAYSFMSCRKAGSGGSSNTTDPLAALDLPATAFNYANQPLPAYLRTPLITGQDNANTGTSVTDWGATLGRVLFYDRTLSINKTISCASCHKQSVSFADSSALSLGFSGGKTGRNSMSLINARFYPNGRFFWDERAATLEIQTLMPVQDHVEMGMTLDTLINRLNATPHYPVLFEKAFGSRTINSDRIAGALAQFVRSIISYQSKFDVGRNQVPAGQDPIQTPYANFTALENQGKQLFFSPQTNCGACHGTETFTAPGARNNGLENPSVDKGVGGVNGVAAREGDFKVTSLRGVELTAPYMHDGRFKTLEEVVEHYNSGVQPNPNLAPQLRNPDGTPRRLNLTGNQKAALVAFMKTLTDRVIITEEKFSNPFR